MFRILGLFLAMASFGMLYSADVALLSEFNLLEAAKKGDLVTVRKCVAQGVDIYARDENGNTAFDIASFNYLHLDKRKRDKFLAIVQALAPNKDHYSELRDPEVDALSKKYPNLANLTINFEEREVSFFEIWVQGKLKPVIDATTQYLSEIYETQNKYVKKIVSELAILAIDIQDNLIMKQILTFIESFDNNKDMSFDANDLHVANLMRKNSISVLKRDGSIDVLKIKKYRKLLDQALAAKKAVNEIDKEADESDSVINMRKIAKKRKLSDQNRFCCVIL